MVRVYHSTTVLLPDGRVISTGSGDGGGVTQQFTYEIFSPPYLFKGPRPSYNLARLEHALRPAVLGDHLERDLHPEGHHHPAGLVHPRLRHGPAAQHPGFQAAADGQSLTVTPPASGRIAPPGPYLLFILNDKGVPSVAQTILLSQ